MAITLEITDSSVFGEVSAEVLGLYGDNGGDPDGNAWLPSQTVDDCCPEAARLINDGYAQMTEVMYANDNALTNLTGIHLGDDWHDDDNVVDMVKAWFNDNTAGWAHYGAYGASDSTWVFKPTAN